MFNVFSKALLQLVAFPIRNGINEGTALKDACHFAVNGMVSTHILI